MLQECCPNKIVYIKQVIMADFKQIQKNLTAARALAESTTKQLIEAKEKLRSLEIKLKVSARNANAGDPDTINQLQQKKAALQIEISTLSASGKTNKKNSFDLLNALTQLEIPARQLEQLNDAFPFLLFPLRLETRFKKITNNGAVQNQLWIRIYPDDCQVESKEDMLSASEISSAQSFWKEIWQAGGVETAERGAWRTFVNNFGSGRASWIIEKYVPLNTGDKKTKTESKDILLVIAPGTALTATEETAAFSFWKKLWIANMDTQQSNEAVQGLITAVGNDRAQEIQNKFSPYNINVNPPAPWKRNDVNVDVVKIIFPSDDDITAASSSWLQAPKAKTLPDRFVVMCYNNDVLVKEQIGNAIPDNLATGPDPSLPENEQMKATDAGDLSINEDLAWMIDFEKAIAVGMGMKINLTADEATSGFQRLLVLGLRLSSDEEQGRQSLEDLISNHFYTKQGFGLIKQGTPSNNTESAAAGYTWLDDSDSSYDILFKQKEAYVETDDFLQKKDGQWLAEYLGVDHDLFKKIPNAAGSDQGEARAMNMALAPTTLGYFMDEMMHPVFTDQDISSTKSFFSNFVSGRGPVPAIRIGKQPYGILPVSAFSRLQFKILNNGPISLNTGSNSFLLRLYNVLKKMDADWDRLAPLISHVGMAGDTEQTLLDILGLHPGSVEFHQRYAESLQHLYNELILSAGQSVAANVTNLTAQKAAQILEQLGFNFTTAVPILQKYFHSAVQPLNGPLIDDVPNSESDSVRSYSADGKNYIEWLASSDVEKIRTQDFGGKPAPTALLYLLLRHSLMLVQADAAVQLHITKGLEADKKNFRDPEFINVQTEGGGKSKWDYLYKKETVITGDQELVSDYIYKKNILQTSKETQQLRDTIKALGFLQNTPTAHLERVFAEHLDCCQYRVDAWKTGLINYKLIEQRKLNNQNNASSKGIYLGSFGWLEEVRPENKVLTPVQLSDSLKLIFPGDEPLVKDNKNLGYIHAPSLNQAATAAILRNAYDTHKNNDVNNPNPFAIDLSSERVRLANQFLEGIRNGQSLSALLGYQFERGLHDKYSLGKGEVDKFIYPLRKMFPLVANHLGDTRTSGDEDKETSIDSIEARNVIDGLKLIRYVQSATDKTYPFGLPIGTDNNQVPLANDAQKQAITEEALRIIDINDAISDMVTTESVYQVVQGNFERSAGNLEAFSKGNHPPEIQVVQTPRSGITLTQRVGLQFDTSASAADSPSAVAQMTPRASAEPSVNKWLSSVLPAPENVQCKVSYKTPASVAIEKIISQRDLGLQSIDLIYFMNLDTEQSMTALDDAIVKHVRSVVSLHPGTEVLIEYTSVIDKDDRSKISFFELSALIKSLRKLLIQSRYLNAGDIALPGEFDSSAVLFDHDQLKTRINIAQAGLKDHSTKLLALSTDGSALDEYARKVSAEFFSIALYGIPQTGTGFMFDGIGKIYTDVTDKIKTVVERWKQKKNDFEAAINSFNASTDDVEKASLLQKAERSVSAIFTFPVPDLITYKGIVDDEKNDFDSVLNELTGLLDSGTISVNNYFNEADTVLAQMANHDVVYFDTKNEKNDVSAARESASVLKQQVQAAVLLLKTDVDTRIADADRIIAAVDVTTSSNDKVQQLINAAKRILGDEALVLPHFSLAATQGNEWQNAFDNSNQLLNYLHGHGVQYPVDDWLCGSARVREKLFHLENAMTLTQGFNTTVDMKLTPVQLPFNSDNSYRWLAMQFRDHDEKFDLGSDPLLYTAHFALPFDKNQSQCGVLVDDWTEVIPSEQENTGISFHYDQPDTEPPQVILLAVPPAQTGRWHWNDLVDTLNETLAMAKKRAVEPQQLDNTGYAQFLPATMMAVTLYWITVATNLASNNLVYDKLNTSSN